MALVELSPDTACANFTKTFLGGFFRLFESAFSELFANSSRVYEAKVVVFDGGHYHMVNGTPGHLRHNRNPRASPQPSPASITRSKFPNMRSSS